MYFELLFVNILCFKCCLFFRDILKIQFNNREDENSVTLCCELDLETSEEDLVIF